MIDYHATSNIGAPPVIASVAASQPPMSKTFAVAADVPEPPPPVARRVTQQAPAVVWRRAVPATVVRQRQRQPCY